MRPTSLLAIAALIPCIRSAAAPPPSTQVGWGQWGTRNMVSKTGRLPDRFDPATNLNVRWVAELGGQTHATPVAAGGRVYIGTNNDRPTDPDRRGDCGILLCLDEQTGKRLWQLTVPKVPGNPFFDWPNTGLVSAPTIEGDRVYILTNRNEVACLDAAGLANGNQGPYTGEAAHMARPADPTPTLKPTDADILWITDLVAPFGIHRHDAAHGSPLIDGPYLWINSSNGVGDDHLAGTSPNAPSLICLDKRTGKPVATDDLKLAPNSIHSQWAPPSCGTVDGRRLVFYGGGDGVCYAFEQPTAGRPLTVRWRCDCDTEWPKGDVFAFQENRKEGPSNITMMPVFHDGKVFVAAGGDLWHGKPHSWLRCIDARGEGDTTRTGVLWTYRMEGHSLATPAILDGLLYTVDSRGTVHCLDAATGKPTWTHETRQETWASPLVADGKLFIATRAGYLWTLATGRTKRLLSSVRLDSAIHGSPFASAGTLYVATQNRLYAFGLPGKARK